MPRFLETLLYLSLFGIIITTTYFIEDNYRAKSYYNPIYWPPAHYIKGPL